ncbi:transposase [Winogradskyella forsetii]|uniref:transposase n=1 Tax=Winogradskyella forsetii TaxID=2686077 RepID=UPI0015BD4520|nr:transposase [Winogradskyella forsetii]
MEKLESGHYYHIYNRGNNKQDIFFDMENYDYFLKLLDRHIKPISNIYAYCLIPNHFHLVIRIHEHIEKPSQAFSNLMNAYTKAINKRYNRSGSLFQKPFKRIRIENEVYLLNLIVYVHLNPLKHNLKERFENYKYSSYSEILNRKDQLIFSNELIQIFDDEENFIAVHKMKTNSLKDNKLWLE